MRRWNQANRSGGPRRRAWVRLNHEIAVELSQREQEMSRTARTVAISGAQAHKYPLQLAAEVQRAERDCSAEDLGICKPTPKDKVKAAITNAYTNNKSPEYLFRKHFQATPTIFTPISA